MLQSRYASRNCIVTTCMGLFIGGTAFSMYLYPGGTWWNPARERHAFWENFLCDLLHDPALNRKPNATGALAAELSMLIFIVGLTVMWSMTERWLSSAGLARLVRRLGVLGGIPLALVPLTPSNHHPRLHTLAVLLGGLPSLAAFLLFCAALLKQGCVPAFVRYLSLALSVMVLVCLAMYACGALGCRATGTILPALERLAVLLLLVWVLLLLRRPVSVRGFQA